MAGDKKEKRLNRIPIRFADAGHDTKSDESAVLQSETVESADDRPDDANPESAVASDSDAIVGERQRQRTATGDLLVSAREYADDERGPVFAELIATRAELKRVQEEIGDLKDRLARRQADYDNFRKRIERERSETYNRAVADLASKLLPVLDNLRRALDTESSVEAGESDEFRHFLSGVDLIYKQLSGVLETMGVKAVPALGERFDPHVHEAVVTEETDEYKPDTVMQEIVRGYRLGEKLLRPALVKVAISK